MFPCSLPKKKERKARVHNDIGVNGKHHSLNISSFSLTGQNTYRIVPTNCQGLSGPYRAMRAANAM